MIYQPLLFPVTEWEDNKFTLYLTNGRDRAVWYFGKEHNGCDKHSVIVYSDKRQNIILSVTIYKDLGINYLGESFSLDELINAINNPNYYYVPHYEMPGYKEKIEKYEKRRKMIHSFVQRCKKHKRKLAYKYCKYTNQVIKWDGRVTQLLSC